MCRPVYGWQYDMMLSSRAIILWLWLGGVASGVSDSVPGLAGAGLCVELFSMGFHPVAWLGMSICGVN